MSQTTLILPYINPKLSLKMLHKLLLHNIYKIKHITLPNGTNLMSPKDFKKYYQTPTKIEKNALNIAEQFFCYPRCTLECSSPCERHPTIRTLKVQYISNNRDLIPRTLNNPLHPPLLQPPEQQQPLLYIQNNPLTFPIQTIKNKKNKKIKDKYKISKQYNTYLCQWTLENNTTYTKWIPQRDLFQSFHSTNQQ